MSEHLEVEDVVTTSAIIKQINDALAKEGSDFWLIDMKPEGTSGHLWKMTYRYGRNTKYTVR